MPKESVIRKKVIDKLSKDGWVTWFPHKARYAKEVDIFGVFDVIGIHRLGGIKLVQLTDHTNVSHRVKKVTAWLAKNRIEADAFATVLTVEVWGWNPKKKVFRIVTL